MRLRNDEASGQMSPSYFSEGQEKAMMKEILSKGGTITVSVKELYAYSTPDTYLFKLDVSGFDKAMSFLQKN